MMVVFAVRSIDRRNAKSAEELKAQYEARLAQKDHEITRLEARIKRYEVAEEEQKQALVKEIAEQKARRSRSRKPPEDKS